jgi:hypothetical protein
MHNWASLSYRLSYQKSDQERHECGSAQFFTWVVVGMPVTRHPPHSPGRAVLPHPVPRLYSLPHRLIPTHTDVDVSSLSVSA